MPLSDRKVRAAGPGRHGDGGNLYLLVKANGTRSWVVRYTDRNGRRRDHGLGSYPLVTLAEARQAALETRRAVRAGRDPIAERRRARGVAFRAVAEELIEAKRAGWRNAKHASQWMNTLAAYVYPHIGEHPVQAVTTNDVLAVLKPIWTARPETASRVRQRIEAVLDSATARGFRSGENPARWRGHLDHLLPAVKRVREVEHLAALDWREAPMVMARLRSDPRPAPRALAFLMLTACRSGEARAMTWGEVDFDAAIWTIPAARMKARREHRVPLVPAALALIGRPGLAEALVFESFRRPGCVMADTSLKAVLRDLDRGEVTVHGMRSCFRDWAGETTAHPREVIEHALAHQLKDKAEAAYARGDLFNKRRALMQDWADFLAREPAQVVQILASPGERRGEQ